MVSYIVIILCINEMQIIYFKLKKEFALKKSFIVKLVKLLFIIQIIPLFYLFYLGPPFHKNSVLCLFPAVIMKINFQLKMM